MHSDNVCCLCSLLINPQHMREGYCSRSVCESVCLSVTALAATYFFCKPQVRCYKVPYAVSNERIVGISLKTLCSPVLALLIYLPPLPSTLPEEFPMNRTNSSGLLSRYKVYRFSDSFYRTTVDKVSSAK